MFLETDTQETYRIVDVQNDGSPPENEQINDEGLVVVNEYNIVSGEEDLV